MTTWTPPATTALSTSDIATVVAGLTNPDSRPDALAFVDTITDAGLLYVIACEVAYRAHLPQPEVASESDYRAFVRTAR